MKNRTLKISDCKTLIKLGIDYQEAQEIAYDISKIKLITVGKLDIICIGKKPYRLITKSRSLKKRLEFMYRFKYWLHSNIRKNLIRQDINWK